MKINGQLADLWEGHADALRLLNLEIRARAELTLRINQLELSNDHLTEQATAFAQKAELAEAALKLVKPWGAQIGQWQATCSACRKSFDMPCQHMCCGFLINADGTKA